ncbi:MAG: hypothetical protein RL204_91 [Bacteroidota bacterium]|jgi:hypothetical protein
MKSVKTKCLALAFLLISAISISQTTLVSGDIAIIGFNYDDPDQILFVPLVDLAQGTQISFTDNGWNGTSLTTNEGTFVWTASSPISKGTTISINPTGISFSTSGDQIFVYQGSSTSPTFIFGLSTKSWVTGSISASTSRKPSTLTTGTNAIAFSTERDNGYFNQVSVTGTKAQALALIANTTKWTRGDSRYSTFPAWIFNISGGVVVTNPEPTTHASNISFSNYTTFSGTVSFNAAASFTGNYLVVRSESPLTSTPIDGVSYSIGDAIGNGKVISNGTSLSVVQKGLRANKTYYYTVYTYLGSTTTINYLQAGAPTASITTPANMIGTYYSSIDTSSISFVSDLQNVIRNPYVKVSYDQYDETMVTQFEFRDTTGGQKVQECAYSGQRYLYTPPFVWYTASPFSREHTWCVSWMPSGGGTGLNEYADQHHLFTVNQNSANGVRSNHPLGEVTSATSTYLLGQYGQDINGNTVYEPMDAQKGDAARALLYMALRYDGVNGYQWNFDELNQLILPALNEDPQDLATLIAWHNADAPDNYEISRNDYIQSIQQNRNPFVDHPEWVNLIDFNSLTKISFAPKAEFTAQTNFEVSVFPNPSADNTWIRVNGNNETGIIQIIDITGRVVYSNTVLSSGNSLIEIENDQLSSGSYLVLVQIGSEKVVTKLIKQ